MGLMLTAVAVLAGLFCGSQLRPSTTYALASVLLYANLQSPMIVPMGTAFVLGAAISLHSLRGTLKYPRVLYLLWFLMFIRVASLLWAQSIKIGINWIVDLIGLIGTIVVAIVACKEGPRPATVMLTALAPFVVIQSIAIILFRLNPSAESQYLASSLAEHIIGPAAAQTESGAVANNVTDPERSAGLLFLNVNRASMVQGVAMLSYAAWAARQWRVWKGLLIALIAVSVTMCGSKTGTALLIVLPVLSFFWAIFSLRGRLFTKTLSIYWILALAAIGAVAVTKFAQTYLQRSQETLLPRQIIWSSAIDFIESYPLTGLGPGGWDAQFPAIAQRNNLDYVPPHNFLLWTGVDTGVLGIIVVLLIMWSSMRIVNFGISSEDVFRSRLGISFMLFAIVWAFIHGMGDNTSFYGTINTVPFFAGAIALGTYRMNRKGSERAVETGASGNRSPGNRYIASRAQP